MAHRFIKGGIWKNSEDGADFSLPGPEILKAAVMKYGKNQWSRIASLMNRKSAKQCKARWYEWLDPSIKKTEWSREEEEKLLHLAKIMPCQWRTIAPIIGRTAAQCLAHYEKLLDQATNRDNDPDDPRRLKTGEIDPNPEAKPALPDMVDMDEDEKEMLQEARARLANTKGKKAKRKAREKQLEEARRLATLQKRREMKAAGLDTSLSRKKRKTIDYAKEIPFQRKPPPGFFDAGEELAKQAGQINIGRGISLAKLEGPSRMEEELKKRKEDVAKAKERAAKDPLADIAKQSKANELKRNAKRGKLNLPEPQITDAELEEIAKITYEPEGDDSSAATGKLLSSYAPSATPVRGGASSVDRTPMRPDTVMSEAQNLAKMASTSTPLLGGENPELNPSDFSDVTPRSAPSATPNPMLQAMTPLRQGPGGGAGGRGATPKRTPVRDLMAINTPSRDGAGEGLGSQKLHAKSLRDKLKAGLSSIPRPKNEVKVVMPDEEDAMDTSSTETEIGSSAHTSDASDVTNSDSQRMNAQKAALLRTQSEVLRRGLPRPATVPLHFAKNQNQVDKIEDINDKAIELVRLEMVNVMLHDAVAFPSADVKLPAGFNPNEFNYTKLTDEDLKEAQRVMEEELAQLKTTQAETTTEEFVNHWQKAFEDLVFVPAANQFKSLNRCTPAEKTAALEHQFIAVREKIKAESKKASVLEKKVSVFHGGYVRRADGFEKAIAELQEQIQQTAIDLACFEALRDQEKVIIPQRIKDLEALVQTQTDREKRLQKRYAELVAAKQKIFEQRAQ